MVHYPSLPPTSGHGHAHAHATMQAKLKNLYNAQKADIKIRLDNPRPAYTSGDPVSGKVYITAAADTGFDDIDIEFVGTSRTYVERLTTAAAISGRSEAFHQFLKLVMPVQELAQRYPEDLVLRAGRTYEFDFKFVVPAALLPRVCSHKVEHWGVRDLHTKLPPTLGDKDKDPSTKSNEEEMLDDMAPEMASIRYGVFARISKSKLEGDDVVRVSLGSKAKRVRVIPVVDEEAPLDVGGENSEYTMRKERTIRKGVLKGKTGTLIMEAAQPPSIRLRARRNSGSEASCLASVILRFDPLEETAEPPKLGSLATKLKVCTYFASTARSNVPEKEKSLLDLSQGLHNEQLNLSSRCVATAHWTKHSANEPISRRASAASTTSTSSSTLDASVAPAPSETYKGKSYYLAKLIVPISLPKNRAFVPTFHSCLISRLYQLKLELSLSGIGSSMDLRVPIQISCEPSTSSSPSTSPRLASVALHGQELSSSSEGEEDEFFEPRTIHVPDAEFVNRSRLNSQTPAYTEIAAPATPAAPPAVVEAPRDEAPPGYSFHAQPRYTALSGHRRRGGGRRVPVF